MKCKYCKSENFIIIKTNNNIGLYCNNCKAWREWLKDWEVRKYKLKGIEFKEELR